MRTVLGEETRRFVIKWVGPAKARIVQVAVTRGDCCPALACLGHRVLGIDTDPDVVASARATARRAGMADCEYRVADAQTGIPVFGEVNRMLVLECWESFSRPRDVLRSARAVMYPGARMLIVTPNRWLPPVWWMANALAGRCGPVCRNRASFPRPIRDLAKLTGFRLAEAVPLNHGATLAVTLVNEDPDD